MLYDLTGERNDMAVLPLKLEYYAVISDPDRAAALFKASINRVGISISSYCNRRCSYCPNSIADRKSAQNLMSDDLFFNILRHLTRIDYDGEINIHRYNEPLSDKAYALSRLRDIRVFLPKAYIHIFSNGDYLDRDYLDALTQAGVNKITATVHSGPGGKTDIESLVKEHARRIEELGIPFEVDRTEIEDRICVATARHEGRLEIEYLAHDFARVSPEGDAWAFDRGGALNLPKTFTRVTPCFTPFTEFEVEWDGTLLPCCQIQNDAFQHDNYVLGKLTPESNLFTAYTSAKYAEWRMKLFSYGAKESPCTTCTYGQADQDWREGAAALHAFIQNAHQQGLA
jgi:hypothetical protein